jgi:hypothetical protein
MSGPVAVEALACVAALLARYLEEGGVATRHVFADDLREMANVATGGPEVADVLERIADHLWTLPPSLTVIEGGRTD